MGCAAPHPMHYEALRERNREALLAQRGVRPHPSGDRAFQVPFLNALYLVDLDGERLSELAPDPARPLEEDFQILLLRYLGAPGSAFPTGAEVSEKELPGGATFFQGPHSLQVAPVLERFGSEPEGFVRAGQALGGEDRPGLGDCALRFEVFPGVPVTFVLWLADEEFPPSLSVLFDRSILRVFELDMIFLLAQVLGRRLAWG